MLIKGILGITASYRLHELEEYLKTVEKYLQKAKTDFETWADEQEKKLSPEERDEFYEFYGDEYWRYSERFPRILRNSFLVSAHSLLEYEMAIICKWLKKDKQIPISWRDLKGDTLERFKSYCKLTGLAYPYNDETWQEIKYYVKVSNCVVHENGLIKKFETDQNFIDYITERDIISHDTIEQEIALTEQFCREVIKNMWTFLSKLSEAYELQRRRQKPKS